MGHAMLQAVRPRPSLVAGWRPGNSWSELVPRSIRGDQASRQRASDRRVLRETALLL